MSTTIDRKLQIALKRNSRRLMEPLLDDIFAELQDPANWKHESAPTTIRKVMKARSIECLKLIGDRMLCADSTSRERFFSRALTKSVMYKWLDAVLYLVQHVVADVALDDIWMYTPIQFAKEAIFVSQESGPLPPADAMRRMRFETLARDVVYAGDLRIAQALVGAGMSFDMTFGVGTPDRDLLAVEVAFSSTETFLMFVAANTRQHLDWEWDGRNRGLLTYIDHLRFIPTLLRASPNHLACLRAEFYDLIEHSHEALLRMGDALILEAIVITGVSLDNSPLLGSSLAAGRFSLAERIIELMDTGTLQAIASDKISAPDRAYIYARYTGSLPEASLANFKPKTRAKRARLHT